MNHDSKTSRAAAALLFAGLATSALAQAPIYVSASLGDDANPGTADLPVATLAAARALPSGDLRRIYLDQGVYQGGTVLNGEKLIGGFSGAGGSAECNKGNNYGGSGEQDDGSNGARGGRGGSGGRGGNGGGGPGGYSIGIWTTGIQTGVQDVTYDIGPGGEPGPGGGPLPGQPGVRENTFGTTPRGVNPSRIPDCNANGTHDLLDIANGDSDDVNQNGIPDECETPPCSADLDGDGELTLFDFLEFQNLFDTGDLAADFDGDGTLTLFDFLAFQNEFAMGC